MSRLKFFPPKDDNHSAYDFIDNLDIKERVQVHHRLELIEERIFLDVLQLGFVKRWSGPIFELKAGHRQSLRVMFCFVSDDIFVIHAFRKKSTATSKRDTDRTQKHYDELIAHLGQ